VSHSQDMVFTLYGDYIRYRGGEAWIGSLIRLLRPIGLSGQAVRSTLSRMARKGWLRSRTASRYSFYSLTPKSIRLLEEGAQHIFQPRADPWDGRWHVLVYSIPEAKRHLRRKMVRRLRWLGFGALNHATWISPRDLHDEVEQVVNAFNIRPYVDFFTAEHRDFSGDSEIVSRCWDLKRLRKYHAALIARYEPLYVQDKARTKAGHRLQPEACFVRRFKLIDAYLSSPYVDPNLPLELLPEGWLGGRATQLFQQYHEMLVSEAEAFVETVLEKAPKVTAGKSAVRRRTPKTRASPTRE
jgi:phenylacetic acid degradation operon negative regulatory protein